MKLHFVHFFFNYPSFWNPHTILVIFSLKLTPFERKMFFLSRNFLYFLTLKYEICNTKAKKKHNYFFLVFPSLSKNAWTTCSLKNLCTVVYVLYICTRSRQYNIRRHTYVTTSKLEIQLLFRAGIISIRGNFCFNEYVLVPLHILAALSSF
jgi:hypothetical protein